MSVVKVKKSPGGYIIIDLKGIYLNAVGVVIPGIADRIEEAVKTGKPIYLSNFVVDLTTTSYPAAAPLLLTCGSDDGTAYRANIIAEDSNVVVNIDVTTDTVSVTEKVIA